MALRCPNFPTVPSTILIFIPVYSLFIYVAVIYLPHGAVRNYDAKNKFVIWVTPVTLAHKHKMASTVQSLSRLASALIDHQLLPGKSKLWVIVEEGQTFDVNISATIDQEEFGMLPYLHLLADPVAMQTDHKGIIANGTLLCWLRAVSRLKEHFNDEMFRDYPSFASIVFTYDVLPVTELSELRITRRTAALQYAGNLGIVVDAGVLLLLTNQRAFYQELREAITYSEPVA